LKTEALFTDQKHTWFTDFAAHFQSVCAEIAKLQKELSLPVISRMEYTMLYTNFINQRYVAEVWVYSDRRYIDKRQRMIGEYDISFLLVYFDELWNKLLSARKRYVGKVASREITAFMIQTLPDFYSYLINIARFAIAEIVGEIPFIDIDKADVFKINVGDYMAKTESVYIEDKNKDTKPLSKLFDERHYNEYSFEDYSKMDFSGCSFESTQFRYSQFRCSCLHDASFLGSSLIGASFYKAHMENCCLEECSIYEADFSSALLKNANFVNARGRAGLPDEEEWWHVGFLPVSFRNADLTSANFTGANLTGADFSGAVLTGTVFTDAILDNAIF